MDCIRITVKYVKSKVSKVKWLSQDILCGEASFFVTGSYDVLGEVCVYDGGVDGVVQKVSSLNQLGAVTDLVILNDNNILAASSNGDVSLFNYNHQMQRLTHSHTHSGLHHHTNQSAAACNALSTNQSGLVASVGEDGMLNVMQADDSTAIVSSFETGDSNDISFLTHSTLATVNSAAQLKLYDIRMRHHKLPKPQLQLSLPRLESLHCIDHHAAQPHMVVVAGGSGCMHCFDTRGAGSGDPLVSYGGHGADVWAIKCHPSDNIFSCSQDGSLLQRSMHPSLISGSRDESIKRDVPATDLMPDNNDSINCLDVVGNSLVAGFDSHQVTVFRNLQLF